LKIKIKALENKDAKINSEIEDSSNDFIRVIHKTTEVIKRLNEKVTLNVGGTLFLTTKHTLTSKKNLLYEMILTEKPNENGEYFIDKSPEYFNIILNYLRGMDIDWESVKNEEKLIKELIYYQIQSNSDDTTFFLKIEVYKALQYRKKKIQHFLKPGKGFPMGAHTEPASHSKSIPHQCSSRHYPLVPQ